MFGSSKWLQRPTLDQEVNSASSWGSVIFWKNRGARDSVLDYFNWLFLKVTVDSDVIVRNNGEMTWCFAQLPGKAWSSKLHQHSLLPSHTASGLFYEGVFWAHSLLHKEAVKPVQTRVSLAWEPFSEPVWGRVSDLCISAKPKKRKNMSAGQIHPCLDWMIYCCSSNNRPKNPTLPLLTWSFYP